MKEKALWRESPPGQEHVSDCCCHCDELAPVIAKLSRQVHMLGVIIDELVSEF
jgi:hypothetical protein